MRVLVIAVTICLVASPGMAINRYYSEALTPGQINRILEREGEIILWYPGKYNGALKRYSRFVVSAASCGAGGVAKTATIEAKEGAQASLTFCARKAGGSVSQISSSPPASGSGPASAPDPAPSPSPSPSPGPEPGPVGLTD